jgi:hypothetical protein
MTLKELALLVRDVQVKQRAYFDNRTNENLVASKEAERKLWRAANQILDPPTLFGDDQ